MLLNIKEYKTMGRAGEPPSPLCIGALQSFIPLQHWEEQPEASLNPHHTQPSAETCHHLILLNPTTLNQRVWYLKSSSEVNGIPRKICLQ